MLLNRPMLTLNPMSTATRPEAPAGCRRLRRVPEQMVRRAVLSLLIGGLGLVLSSGLSGCIVAQATGGMLESNQRFQKVDIDAKYRGLENQRVAVMISAPYEIQYEHVAAVPAITDLISVGIAGGVAGAEVVPTNLVLAYQDNFVYWEQMDYADIARDFGVSRLVLVDLVEYRLVAPGNSYVWDGYAAAEIDVIEIQDGRNYRYGYSDRVIGRFPSVRGVGRDQEPQAAIEQGLQLDFGRRVLWLFRDHTRTRDEISKDLQRR